MTVVFRFQIVYLDVLNKHFLSMNDKKIVIITDSTTNASYFCLFVMSVVSISEYRLHMLVPFHHHMEDRPFHCMWLQHDQKFLVLGLIQHLYQHIHMWLEERGVGLLT